MRLSLLLALLLALVALGRAEPSAAEKMKAARERATPEDELEDEEEEAPSGKADPDAERGLYIPKWQAAMAAANAANAGEGELVPPLADEWYTVTIADVSVGFMHTTTEFMPDAGRVGRSDGMRTMELMDVQVSRGTDTSRMAFETVFEETGLDPVNTTAMPEAEALRGGVKVMAYDQRFANNEVKMNASFAWDEDTVKLTSYNGNAEHVSIVELPTQAWLGRMRARLEFMKQCRQGKEEIVVQTMRPELGPKVVNLSSTFMSLKQAWDGEKMVEASVWTVQISDVPVNMTEVYAIEGPLRCYRLLQMGLDMPFGFLLASLSEKEAALKAAEHDPDRVLPELVYTMFVPLAKPIRNVNEARRLKIAVSVKGEKGPKKLELPTAGYQKVTTVKNTPDKVLVSIDLQDPVPATEEELVDKEYQNPSAMVDNHDEVVIDLSHKIDAALKRAGHSPPPRGEKVPAGPMQFEVAYMLRDLVHNHIKDKHLSTAYASASETARTGSGDCTEHAVLLAALVKARGIPSRVCHGLVYVEQGGSAINGQAEVDAHGNVVESSMPTTSGQFGWHMWSQALINGAWYDLDATLHIPYSVGHVLVGTSSMADKEAHNNHMQMAALIGNLAITVREVRYDWKDDQGNPLHQNM